MRISGPLRVSSRAYRRCASTDNAKIARGSRARDSSRMSLYCRDYRAQHSQQVVGVVVRRWRNVRMQYGTTESRLGWRAHYRDSHVCIYSSAAIHNASATKRRRLSMKRVSLLHRASRVSSKALTAIIDNGGRGAYRDNQPWLIAAELLEAARAAGASLPLILATGAPLELAHWANIRDDRRRRTAQRLWESRCDFDTLARVSPIFTALDSLMLKPGDDASTPRTTRRRASVAASRSTNVTFARMRSARRLRSSTSRSTSKKSRRRRFRRKSRNRTFETA